MFCNGILFFTGERSVREFQQQSDGRFSNTLWGDTRGFRIVVWRLLEAAAVLFATD